MAALKSLEPRYGKGVRFWQNDGSTLPTWVKGHAVESPRQNGTFLIVSKVGHQRVHAGFAVIEFGGVAFTCDVADVDQLIQQCRSEAATLTGVGPGKRSRTGTASPRPHKSATRDGRSRVQPYPPPHGARPSIEWIFTGELSVDETYQRKTDNDASRRLIASIASNFDWRLFGVLLVSRRPDESLKVIDGQHRWTAAAMRGDIDQVPCSLSRFSTAEEEARFFIVANRARKNMNRLDDFHAALAAADDDALEIQCLVTDAGLTVARSTSASGWGTGQIAFTSSIARAIRMHGAPVASAALTNIAEAFPDQRLGHGGSIFAALVKIFANPPADFDPDRLLTALQSFDIEGWGSFMEGLKGGDTRALAMREAILATYERTPAGDSVADLRRQAA